MKKLILFTTGFLLPLEVSAAYLNPYTLQYGTSANTIMQGNDSRVANSATVATNAALKALAVGTLTNVSREGFYAPGDAGQASYLYSSSACTLNSGAGDNGLQVAPTSGGGCWIAQVGSSPISIGLWGADPTSTNGSSTAISNACADAAGRQLYAPAGIYLIDQSITISTTCNLKGDGWWEPGGNTAPGPAPTTAGQGAWFKITSTSITPFTFTGQSVNGSHWEGFSVYQSQQYHHFAISATSSGTSLTVSAAPAGGTITTGQFLANSPMTIGLGQVYITSTNSCTTTFPCTYTLNEAYTGNGAFTLWGEVIYTNPVFNISNTTGEVQFENIMLYGVSKGFSAQYSQRFNAKHIRGQCFEYCIFIDQDYDEGVLDDIHFSPYWDSDNAVYSAQALNLNNIISLRNDSPQWGSIFCFGGHSCVEFGQSTQGSGISTTTGATIASLISDYNVYGLWVPNTVNSSVGPDVRIANAYFSGASPSVNDTGLQVDGVNSNIRFGNFRIYYENCNAISYTNTLGGNILSIAALDMQNIGLTPSVCPLTGAIQSVQSTASGGVPNKLKLLSEPTLTNSYSGLLVFGFASNSNNTQNYVYLDSPTTNPWSPVLSAAGGSSPTFSGTYTNQYGRWSAGGAKVDILFNTTFSSSSSSGSPTVMNIGNLPFWSAPATSSSSPPQNAYGECAISQASGITYPSGTTTLVGYIPANANYIQIYAQGSNTAAVPVPPANFASAFSISGSCTYNRY